MNGKVVFLTGAVRQFSTTKASQSGGAIVELVFLVPLLLLIIAGLTEMGMVIGQATWVSESAYQTTLVGGEDQKFLGNKSMQDKYNKFYSLQGARFTGSTPTLSPSYDSTNRTVKFETTGQLRPLLMSEGLGSWLNAHFNLNLGVYYVGSHMAQSPGAVLNGLSVFGNNLSGKYCGCSQICEDTVPNTIPCSSILGGTMPAPQQVGGNPVAGGGGGGGSGGGGGGELPEVEPRRAYH